ncbi:DUF2470 domain-containing protein [Nocardia puris]|uniref:Uncharacterized protein DUF2470 n=1 Tax=Nocardia puris TaxID=208602 RepID=A0A366DNV3_9NOCA|nr:DUF2470 domain-containing protein [Nocardia puris]MBF6214209.1 DUF2470 domain-containing protein [Nocardia puris]MBF6365301.1 DUF2470 domain-containing protein [Nocardia puris]MBF6459703.1 DUF2470 domain-containing protein [Nocardia puris]RBO91752.1 uncharacterized protein DUF2470 [Nocardia puris]
MPKSTVAPTTAERVRSACAQSDQAVLALPGIDPTPTSLHHVRGCGDVVVAVPTGSLAAVMTHNFGPGGAAAVLELTDHAPLPLREPVRALVWLRGTVRAVPAQAQRVLAGEVAKDNPDPALLDVGHTSTLLRLVINTAVVADSTGAESVCVEELRTARPDPFCELESAWLQHMDTDHADVIAQLARHLPPRLQTGSVHPLAIDRYGVTLRVEGHDGDHDFRLPFSAPADDVESLSRAVRTLAGCPFLNGLRRI